MSYHQHCRFQFLLIGNKEYSSKYNNIKKYLIKIVISNESIENQLLFLKTNTNFKPAGVILLTLSSLSFPLSKGEPSGVRSSSSFPNFY